jgi:hypothetical protein
MHALVLYSVCCHGFRREECRLHSPLCQLPVAYPSDISPVLRRLCRLVSLSPSEELCRLVSLSPLEEVDCSLVFLVLKALQRHPEAGALWEKHTKKILDDLSFVRTTHEQVSTGVRPTERSSFCADKSTTSLSLVPTLLWRKVQLIRLER